MKANDNIPAAEFRMAEKLAREALANEKFKALPPAKQRVAIAKDVLKWIAAGKLFADHYYCGLTTKKPEELKATRSYEHYDSSLETEDHVNGYTCVACGIGSLFACAVERGLAGGTLKVTGYSNPRVAGDAKDIWKALAGLYDKDQLLLIECAYEGDKDAHGFQWPSGGTPCDVRREAEEVHGSEKLEACFKWRQRIKDDAKRLTAIMDNIIANKGTFVP